MRHDEPVSSGGELNPQVEEAMRLRLAKLGGMPVDTSHLERSLRAQLPARPAIQEAHKSHLGGATLFRRWWRAGTAVAAGLLLVLSVALFTLPGREVQAAPEDMIQRHEMLVNGTMPGVHRVSSVEEANQFLKGTAPQLPLVPQPGDGHLDACCMDPVHNRNVACVLMDMGGKPVTMCVAKASDFALPKVTPVKVGGSSYYCQSVRGYSMVMTEHGGTWVCLVGKVTEGELVKVASELRF